MDAQGQVDVVAVAFQAVAGLEGLVVYAGASTRMAPAWEATRSAIGAGDSHMPAHMQVQYLSDTYSQWG